MGEQGLRRVVAASACDHCLGFSLSGKLARRVYTGNKYVSFFFESSGPVQV